MILSTATPIKTPFSSINDYLKDRSFASHFSEFFNTSTVNWKYGYGNLSLDNIPSKLQPKIALEFNDVLHTFIKTFTDKYELDITQAKVYFFEHNIAIIMLDMQINNADLISNINSDFDIKISELVDAIFQKTLLQPFNILRNNKELANTVGINTNTTQYRDIEKKTHNWVLWTARYLILPPKFKTNKNLINWCSLDTNNLCGTDAFNFFIGSGNGLVLTQTPEMDLEDFKKTMILPQFYYAFLSCYGENFESTLERFKKLNGALFSPKRKIDKLLSQTQTQIDNQEYLALAVSDAIRGTQGIRLPLLQQIFENWRLKELEQDTAKKTDFLYKKLDSWMKKIIQNQNRTIEVVLSLMGGIALIDFILNLLMSAPDLKDRTIDSYSIISLFSELTADTAIYASSSLLFLALLYIYFKRK